MFMCAMDIVQYTKYTLPKICVIYIMEEYDERLFTAARNGYIENSSLPLLLLVLLFILFQMGTVLVHTTMLLFLYLFVGSLKVYYT